MILDTKFLDELTEKAKESPRLRMNYNLHDSLESKAQRLFNGLEPGTVLPIHRHADTSESYILIRGSLRVTLLDDNKNVTESVELDLNKGVFGFQIPANTWHKVEVLESGTVIFEVKDGPYTPLTQENILE
ncbi:MAG: WbuC family cupin fold metalloprotein [Treponema sp.]|nr:WbuC family cupin fold metalloprotein [Treponema sp.]MBQ2234718.1 WbuC family cupin fold metalloprotein [Treponema sp.]